METNKLIKEFEIKSKKHTLITTKNLFSMCIRELKDITDYKEITEKEKDFISKINKKLYKFILEIEKIL